MAHIGRTIKNVEAPRPLKSQQRSSLKNNYLVIEELIQLIENVALNLQSGINNPEPMTILVQNLRILGPQLETVSKDILDRSFVVFRNASQDERLNIMTRLNLLELIELRAKGWEDNGINSYYKTKQANNIEMNDIISEQTAAIINSSPTYGNNATGIGINTLVTAQQQQQQQQQHHHPQFLLGPGEVIRNSGKFLKPTKIPGKTYCKDEIVIRNADSGKVMGIKGRRVHMIEELSETIISFQRVNPGAKERLVQITGQCEEKINYAKQLIEDTIRRNASPVRLEPVSGGNGGGGGSCSSLASSNSDDVVHRVQSVSGSSGGGGGGGGNTNIGSNLSNRLSFNSVQNFMTSNAAAQQMSYQQQQQQQHQQIINLIGTNPQNNNNSQSVHVGGKSLRTNLNQLITHSYSTNDASLGEYKFTVNVGEQHIKITGDNFKLVQLAKLVLDDYFSSAEFLASVEAGAALDGTLTSPISTPTTPLGQPQFIMGTNPLHTVPPLADSGIGLNYMSNQMALNPNTDGDDEVFIDGEPQSNGLARSRRSHFSRKDSTPEDMGKNKTITTSFTTQASINAIETDTNTGRTVHDYDHLLYYAKSPHSWKFPNDWERICQKFPSIIRNKVNSKNYNNTTNMHSQNDLTKMNACVNSSFNNIISTKKSLSNNIINGAGETNLNNVNIKREKENSKYNTMIAKARLNRHDSIENTNETPVNKRLLNKQFKFISDIVNNGGSSN